LGTLCEEEWHQLAEAHERRVRIWTDPHQARAAKGEKHPVYDFLFAYYSHRPAWLRRWQPGPERILAGASARVFLERPDYQETKFGVSLGPLPEKRRTFVKWLHGLLMATQTRPAFFGCFGLHEWAMVYRQTPEEVRHNQYPLRFPPDQVAEVLEMHPLRCTHFDAYRFFTKEACGLNRQVLTRENVTQQEQGGCLHANMDLYKWTYKLGPYVAAEWVADCFELAKDIRELDMCASPYDLAALGFAPVKIETPEGRAIYENQQRVFSMRASRLRENILNLCETLLS